MVAAGQLPITRRPEFFAVSSRGADPHKTVEHRFLQHTSSRGRPNKGSYLKELVDSLSKREGKNLMRRQIHHTAESTSQRSSC